MWTLIAELHNEDGESHGLSAFGPYDTEADAKDAEPEVTAWAAHLGYTGEYELQLHRKEFADPAHRQKKFGRYAQV